MNRRNSVRFVLRGKDQALLGDTGGQAEACRVTDLQVIADGTRPDVSPDGTRIGYDQNVDGTDEIFIMDTAGSAARCLTCDATLPAELRGKHKGKVTFHPGGTYLLFGAENEYGKHTVFNTAGIGDDNDLWMMDLSTGTYWRLTHLPRGSAVQYPRFSPDGTRLLWSERYQKGKVFQTGKEYGLWTIKLAEFTISQDGPQLGETLELTPGGPGFYEPHGFSPDGNKIIFSAAFDPGRSQFYASLYTYDLRDQQLTQIAGGDEIHYEQGLFSPGGSKISFMAGPFVGLTRQGYKTDLYMMDADGSNRVRLTYLNDPKSPDYTGGSTIIDKNVWMPDGTAIISAYHVRGQDTNKIIRVDLAGDCDATKPNG
jgi:Tol biopolymer transport system component